MRRFLFLLMFVITNLIVSAYAKETVKIIVPYTAGGLSDRIARQLQTYLSNDDYDFVVENRVGAGGMIGAQSIVDDNKPMLLVTGQALVSNQVLGNAKYDVEKDFIFLSCLITDTTVVITNSNSDIKKLQDIHNTNKATIAYGTSGIGTVQHMVSPIVAGFDKKQIEVPFKGAPEVANALLSGTIDWYVDNLTVVTPMIESGKFRILASSQKLKKYPDVPSFKELNIDIHGFRSKQLFVANNNITPQLKSYIEKRIEEKQFANILESLGYDSCINTKLPAGLKAEKETIRKLLK